MKSKIKTYSADDIDVTYDIPRCIHAKECVNGLRAVFDEKKRPWIQPDQAPADQVAEVILRCPTGALHFERKDGDEAEQTPDRNTVELAENGPVYVRGDVTIINEEKEALLKDTRVALCRCGASKNKPLCDNSHLDIDFEASTELASKDSTGKPIEGVTELMVEPAPDGPLILMGNFEILDASGNVVYSDVDTALCRCGGSKNKPFCDGSHHIIGFKSE